MTKEIQKEERRKKNISKSRKREEIIGDGTKTLRSFKSH